MELNIDFEKNGGLVPCIVQDDRSLRILMMGYMNAEALKKTQEDGRVTFYSRSKGRLWTKGETSGNFLDVVAIIPDCDNDTLLIRAVPHGPVCHTGADTCFSESNNGFSLAYLERVIRKRRDEPAEGSYTTSLFRKGINKIAQKVGEEAVELIIESKDDNRELFLNEAADLMYHYLVLLTAKGFRLDDVANTLAARHGEK